ncbi:MAG: hypothetical protein ACLGHP_10615 [Vicinamibacteria bacterium]
MPFPRRLAGAPRSAVSALLAIAIVFLPRAAAAQSDIDALMSRVLANREASWRRLQDLLLTERERLSLVGPDGGRLFGMDREYAWVAREGKAIRSLTRVNGVESSLGTVTTDEPEHEERGLGEFMKFPFDPENYYLVGREAIDGVEVLRIEYYPTKLFGPDKKDAGEPRDEEDDRLDVAFNKVSQVTLWVDPDRAQIVRAIFENVDFSFLPGRSLVRVEQARATLEMGQPIADAWLPKRTVIEGAATLATGTYRATFRRDFFDYRQADVKVRFRVPEGEP